MTPAERIISRLSGVRELKPQQWTAKCPAHNDKNPSLSIREVDSLKVLVKCWAGCGAAEVMDALGLSLSDLFDNPPREGSSLSIRDRSHPHAALAALKSVADEVLLVAIAAENCAEGQTLTPEDKERLILAAGRIRSARGVVV